MRQGRLYYHDLGAEGIRCKRGGERDDGRPLFKLCIVTEDERIEIRNLGVEQLIDLRDQLDKAIAWAGAGKPPAKRSGTR